jgi:sortase (surface protein transpeptidase)
MAAPPHPVRILAYAAILTVLWSCASATTPTGSGAQRREVDDPSVPKAVENFRSTRRVESVGRPRKIRIPVIDVNSALEPLGKNPDGTIEVPQDWQTAGWYTGGARPGQRGPAVILGHVDSKMGPAVFYRARELSRGDKIFVDQAGGQTATFVVDRVERFPKERFPTSAVYFPTLKPVLRLVTCGGAFDESVGHYKDNVIVFAKFAE